MHHLENLLKQNSLPHGVLLLGSEEESLLATAKSLASKILKTENLEAHPDYVLLRGEKVEDVRNLLAVLALKSFGERVVVLEAAENLTPQAVNNLLKKIEEPADKTFFIVLSMAPAKLLPTLRSRLMAFNIDTGSSISPLMRGDQRGVLANNFLVAAKLPERLQILSEVDPHTEDLHLFLKKIYENEIKNIGPQTGKRIEAILQTFQHLSANVAANRALAWLAVKWR